MTRSRSDVQAMQLRERIALATAAAMFVAGVILVTAILPAEYGVDPVGTGKMLGTDADRGEGGADGEPDGSSRCVPGANTPQPLAFRRNTMTFKLGPRGRHRIQVPDAEGRHHGLLRGGRPGRSKSTSTASRKVRRKATRDFYERAEKTSGDGVVLRAHDGHPRLVVEEPRPTTTSP